MPTINVAPIYTNAFAKTIYEGFAIVVEEDLHSVKTTLLGVTCRLYWVKFFYTEINVLRWVELTSIQAWTDLQRRTIPCSSVDDATWFINSATEIQRLINSTPGTGYIRYFNIPHLALEDVIYALGCLFSIPTLADPACYCELSIYDQSNTTPFTNAIKLDSVLSYTQSNTYISLAKTCVTPITMNAARSLAMRLDLYQKLLITNSLYIRLKSFYIDTARLL
jgi:hypothetical protein